MIEPTSEVRFNERGFMTFDPVPSGYGGHIRVYESSIAFNPHMWAQVVCPANFNEPDGPTIEAVAHISLDNARILREQIDHLIARMEAYPE